MALTEQPSHELIRRLRACGLTLTLSRQIVAQFQQWRKDHNFKDEWVCEHIKALKIDLIRYMGGLPPISPWVRRRKDGITPVGPFGALWAISRTRPFSALNAMNIYTSLVYEPSVGDPKITPKQAKGFVEAVHRPRPTPQAVETFEQLLSDLSYDWKGTQPEFAAPAVLDVPIKPYKRSPIPGRGLVAKEKVFPRCFTILSLCPPFYRKHRPLIDSALGSLSGLIPVLDETHVQVRQGDPVPVILNKMVNAQAAKDSFEMSPTDAIVGRVSFIQDSGYKLRHVFVTNEIVQICSLPLQEFLMNELKRHPQDCTFDQEEGIRFCQEMLKLGYTANCFDLTKCSDNLPRSFQISYFKKMGLDPRWIEWFSDVTSSLWEIDDILPAMFNDGSPNPLLPGHAPYVKPQRFKGLRMRMTVGQQLGFGPSFPAFALLHHAIVDALFARHKKPKMYRILGDDLFIFDDQVAKDYETVMPLFGVPISQSKTIRSNRVAEFAGRVIFPTKVVSTFKWKGRCSDNNFLDIARNLGPRSLGLFRHRQRFIAEVMGWIPEPFGLGWNPQGLNYEDRILSTQELWLRLIDDKDIRSRHYQRRTSRINRMIYDYPEWTRGLTLVPSADQADHSVLVRTFPFVSPNRLLLSLLLEDNWEIMLPNLDLLARSLDIADLNGVDVMNLLSRYSWIEKLSKLSQLTIYERKLGLSPVK